MKKSCSGHRLMLKAPAFIVLFLFCIGSQAQKSKQNFARTFRAYAIPDSAQSSISDLSNYIKQTFPTDSDKVKAVFLWMAGHIRYDMDAFLNDRVVASDQEPKVVFKKRTGVCAGYSSLFAHFCDRLGIPAYTISGYAKAYGYRKEGAFDFDRMGHAWNAVKLYQSWYLMEVTWASNALDEHDTAAVLRYYKADPIILGNDHFPEDPMWQLRYHPLSFEQWRHPKYEYFVPGFKDTTMNYLQLLKQYEKMNTIQQQIASLRRSEAFLRANIGPLDESALLAKNNCSHHASSIYLICYSDYARYFALVHAQPQYARVHDTTWTSFRSQFILHRQHLDSALVCLHSLDAEQDTTTLNHVNDLRMWFDREIQCIDHYTDRSPLGRRTYQFYSRQYDYFRDHPYTLKHEPLVKGAFPTDSLPIAVGWELLFPCIPTYQFSRTNVIFGFGVNFGYRIKNSLLSLQAQLYNGSMPDYEISFQGQTRKANSNAIAVMTVGIEQYIWTQPRTEWFAAGRAGFSELGQYHDSKDKSKVLNDYSPLLSLESGFYYRGWRYARYLRPSITYNWLWHDTDGMSNISGGLLTFGVAYGVGGNKR